MKARQSLSPPSASPQSPPTPTPNALFNAIKTSNISLAKALFTKMILSINTLVDPQLNSTPLHMASNQNNYELVQYFLAQYDKMIAEEMESDNEDDQWTRDGKLDWINRKDDDGFTCIHYAVFRGIQTYQDRYSSNYLGNSKMTFLLQENGADIYSINKQGLTVLHIAAQGDSPLLMFYFLNKGMKISTVDAKGSTALHWACYSGQENAVNALLSWQAEIDLQDFTYGMTPLHLAVMSGNGKIVRKLLIRGCERNIKNFNGKLPLDIAIENQYKNITQMILDKGGLQELLNIKSPFRKVLFLQYTQVSKYTFPFKFLLFLFLSNYLLNVSFVIGPHLKEEWVMALVYSGLGLFIMILFVVVCKKSPGEIIEREDNNYFQMLMRNTPARICFDCHIIKPDRSKHCQICMKCIQVYDHHCPWVANCIGAKNYFAFYSFLILMEVFMVYTVFFQINNLIRIDWHDSNALEVIRIVCIFYCFVCSALFFLPLTFLIMVQTKNLFLNKTTYQRYSKQTNTKPKPKAPAQQSNYQPSSNESLHAYLLKDNSQQVTQTASMAGQTSMRVPSNATAVRGTIAPSNQGTYGSNCYSMCFGNANNIRYQIANIRQ